jgi:hypothetical protein
MMTNGKQRAVTELEAQLVRLNALVRERRNQLARLDKCPNKDCPCRFVWREHVEKNLAGQMGKIRRQVRAKSAQRVEPMGGTGLRSGKRNTPRRRSRGQNA